MLSLDVDYREVGAGVLLLLSSISILVVSMGLLLNADDLCLLISKALGLLFYC